MSLWLPLAQTSLRILNVSCERFDGGSLLLFWSSFTTLVILIISCRFLRLWIEPQDLPYHRSQIRRLCRICLSIVVLLRHY